jgi:hypothetical protein
MTIYPFLLKGFSNPSTSFDLKSQHGFMEYGIVFANLLSYIEEIKPHKNN